MSAMKKKTDDCETDMFSGSDYMSSPLVILTWAVIGCQVAAVTGGVGEVRDHHADAGRGTEASTP